MTLSKATEDKSYFAWIRPSMIADGLLVAAAWQEEHAALASAHFSETRLRQAAVVLAVLHPHVIDYIAQAPVLVLAAAGDRSGDLRYRRERLHLAARFIAAAGPSHRLPHIMRAYGLTPPMRQMQSLPLSLSHHRLLKPLAAVPEVRLAQIIPASRRDQAAWLTWLSRLALHRWATPLQRDRFLTWATATFTDREQYGPSFDLADWAMFESGAFDPKMSLEQAQAASRRWHEQHASRRLLNYSPSELACVVDYGPLPITTTVDGLELHALRTIAELDMESQRMHHCVRSYWPFVASGRSRIYSIRHGETRYATLELQPDTRKRTTPRPLKFAQLRGPCNAPPAEPVIACALHFIDLANAAIAETARLAQSPAARTTAAQPEATEVPAAGGGR